MSGSPKPPFHQEPFFIVFVVILFIALIWECLLPHLSGGGPTIKGRIWNNLEQIETAKRLWATDHKATNSTPVSEADLISYFPRGTKPGQLVAPVVGERYIINAVGVPSAAQLTHSVGKWPEGKIIRFPSPTNTTNQVTLPSNRAGTNDG